MYIFCSHEFFRYQDDTFMQNLFRIPIPNDVPELTMTDDDLIAYREIVEKVRYFPLNYQI